MRSGCRSIRRPGPARGIQDDPRALSRPRNVTYYSGAGKRGDKLHGTIDDFCARFGEKHFGCRQLSATKWDCGDHHYAASDQRLRVEPSFRAAFEDGLKRAAAEKGVDLSAVGL